MIEFIKKRTHASDLLGPVQPFAGYSTYVSRR